MSDEAIDLGRLLDWLEGRLDPAAAMNVQHAVEGSDDRHERTRRRVEWLNEFRDLARTAIIEDPPPGFADDAMARFRDARMQQALLIFDSRRDRVGVRGDEPSEDWSLLFDADGIGIAVDVAVSGDRLDIAGQVLIADPGRCRGVQLRTPDGDVDTLLDDLGQFSLGRVDPGQHRLVVLMPDTAIGVGLSVAMP